MLRYFILRITGVVPLVFLSVFIVFWLGYMAPGDPISRMYEDQARENPQFQTSQEQIDRLKARYGLDRPFLVQYVDYMGNLLHGDFGRSISLGGTPILPTILKVLPISAQVGIWGIIILVFLGLPLGTLAALKHNTKTDYIIVSSALVFNNVPVFVTAPLALIILVNSLKVMDVPYGFHGMFSKQIILPAIFMGLGPISGIIRQTRVGMLEVMSSDYVRTARAKGLTRRMVIMRHVMRTGLTPVVTSLGMTVGGLLTGSLFVERIFGIPGYGRLSFYGITTLDYPMMLGFTIFGALMVMLANLLTDLAYPFLDPRVVYD